MSGGGARRGPAGPGRRSQGARPRYVTPRLGRMPAPGALLRRAARGAPGPARRGSAPGHGVWRGPGGGRGGRGREPRGRRWPWCAGGRGGTPAARSPEARGVPSRLCARPAPRRARVTPRSGVGCPRLADACGWESEPPKLGAARGPGPSGSGRGHAGCSAALLLPRGIPTLARGAKAADNLRSCPRPRSRPRLLSVPQPTFFDNGKQIDCSEPLAGILFPTPVWGFFFLILCS